MEDESTEVTLRDSVILDGFSRTRDGYISATARVARTGIQIYDGRSVNRPDLKRVRIFRPEEEVFSPDSMRSFAWKPMTNDHPSKPVSSDNWKDFAVGQVGDEIARDGQTIRVPLVLMDSAAIQDFDNGKRQLSVGYQTKVVWEPGVTEDGEEYDGFQTNIRVNHLALVAAARGGPELRVGDKTEGESAMAEKTLKTITVDGLSAEMTDSAVQIVQKHLDSVGVQLKDAETKFTDAAAKIAELGKQLETKDAEIVTLKKQVEDAKITDSQLDAMVSAREEVIVKGRTLVGDSLVVENKSTADIRRAVVSDKLGEDVVKDWSDDQIIASFDTYAASVSSKDSSESSVRRLGKALATNTSGAKVKDGREAALEKRDQRLADAWKGPAQQQA